uniref:Uncharacterized protein n=1 Tax=Oreochromis niloticus TaxID=8128 RepID=A0A669CVR2_ORENI
MEPTGDGSPTVPEPELYRSIQAVLPRETDQLHHSDCFNKGMLRWTLHKKVQKNPANSLSLVWLLIKELEKIKTERFIPGIISDLDILIEFKIWGDKRLAYVRTACLNSC